MPTFVNPVRSYSRLVADKLEAVDGPGFRCAAGDVLEAYCSAGRSSIADLSDGDAEDTRASVLGATTPAAGR